jgi:hypothetical protein
MNKVVTALLATAFIIAPVRVQAVCQPIAQSRCNLSEANFPSVRGVRLGVTAEQLLALFPGASKRKEIKDALERAKTSTNEAVYLGFDPADGSKEQFAGVDSISAGLHRSRVADFTVMYGGQIWTSIDEWVSKLSETLGLPGLQYWVPGPSENPNKVLKCSGIEIEAALQGGSASIRIRNTSMNQRPSEEKKPVFKP